MTIGKMSVTKATQFLNLKYRISLAFVRQQNAKGNLDFKCFKQHSSISNTMDKCVQSGVFNNPP